MLSLACIKMRMTPEEVINAATLNGAAALELRHDYGSIAKGKMANIFIAKEIRTIGYFMYAFGSDLVDEVILKGERQVK